MVKLLNYIVPQSSILTDISIFLIFFSQWLWQFFTSPILLVGVCMPLGFQELKALGVPCLTFPCLLLGHSLLPNQSPMDA